jgi:hypothetical protein
VKNVEATLLTREGGGGDFVGGMASRCSDAVEGVNYVGSWVKGLGKEWIRKKVAGSYSDKENQWNC